VNPVVFPRAQEGVSRACPVHEPQRLRRNGVVSGTTMKEQLRRCHKYLRRYRLPAKSTCETMGTIKRVPSSFCTVG
jgi:hypothetical protein